MFIADLHIHSKYSRATSKDCIPEYLDLWARRKGIGLIGTGDFTHPAWREQLKEKLMPAEDGFYTLKKEFRLADQTAEAAAAPRFVLSVEISSIYKKNGKVRKVHHLILLPGIEQAESVSQRLELIGNLHSDGRPILGLDSRDLMETVLTCCPEAVFIPAHIWTPHFSMFGAFSGFETVEECFEDMTPYIYALETGLSSDPAMNWRLSALDRYTLISNSDAHSPSKLGREANLFYTMPDYPAMARALRKETAGLFAGTIEFFPEEGKYHYDGHRACKICLKPSDAPERCPVCGRKLTIGVLHRIEALADRPEDYQPEDAAYFQRLIPLPEVIAASLGVSSGSVKVRTQYEALLQELGPEFYILREAPIADIQIAGGACIAEGIRRMRSGRVQWSPGYDGEYGKLHLLDETEIKSLSGQLFLFDVGPAEAQTESAAAHAAEKIAEKGHSAVKKKKAPVAAQTAESGGGFLQELNPEQQAAVFSESPVTAVVAGPGTGKTKTLIARIAYLAEERKVPAGEITAVTFTNRAAGEMQSRLVKHFGGTRRVKNMHIGTFHGLCLQILSAYRESTGAAGSVTVIDEYEALTIAGEVIAQQQLSITPRKFLTGISRMKNGTELEAVSAEAYAAYSGRLKDFGVLDYDDLLTETLALFENSDVLLPEKLRRRFRYLFVDEFQDINELQYRLVRAWSRESAGLFLIGDPDQAIYGFRGADARCFARIETDMDRVAWIRLDRNYRSAPEIIRCALPVICRNAETGTPRSLKAQRQTAGCVRLLTAQDDFSEALFIAKEINRMTGGIDMIDIQSSRARQEEQLVRGFSDIAVLYRTHRQAEMIEMCLKKESIPYIVAGRDQILAEEGVRGIVCFFRWLLNPADLISLRCALRILFACGEELLGAAVSFFRQHPEAVGDAETFYTRFIQQYKQYAQASAGWGAAIERFFPVLQKEKPYKLVDAWIESYVPEATVTVERFRNMAVFYNNMEAFLYDLTLGGEIDVRRSGGKIYTPEAVTLTTLHGAKGLEYPVVFLSGVRPDLIPLKAAGKQPEGLEEERRLFYVGMTRARDELILLTGPQQSPFLRGIPEAALQTGRAEERKSADYIEQLSLFSFSG